MFCFLFLYFVHCIENILGTVAIFSQGLNVLFGEDGFLQLLQP